MKDLFDNPLYFERLFEKMDRIMQDSKRTTSWDLGGD